MIICDNFPIKKLLYRNSTKSKTLFFCEIALHVEKLFKKPCLSDKSGLLNCLYIAFILHTFLYSFSAIQCNLAKVVFAVAMACKMPKYDIR